MALNEAQVATLESFYLTDCQGGALRSTLSLARAGGPSSVSFRFVSPPVIT